MLFASPTSESSRPRNCAGYKVSQAIIFFESRISGIVPNRKHIFICFALRDRRYLRLAIGISPSVQKFSLFDIPAKNLFIGAYNGPPGTGIALCPGVILVWDPDRVGRGGCDEAEGL